MSRVLSRLIFRPPLVNVMNLSSLLSASVALILVGLWQPTGGAASETEGLAEEASAMDEICVVYRVRGDVWTGRRENVLQIDQTVALGDTIRFGSSDAAVLLVCPEEGSVVLPAALDSEINPSTREGSSLWRIVQKAAFRHVGNSLGTKGEAVLERTADLDRHFHAPYLLLGDHSLPLGGDLLDRIQGGAQLVLTDVDETASHLLTVTGGRLIFPRSAADALVQDSGKADSSRLLLWEKRGESRSLLIGLDVALPDPNRVEREVQTLIAALQQQNRPAEDIREEVYVFLLREYGRPYPGYIDPWLRTLGL